MQIIYFIAHYIPLRTGAAYGDLFRPRRPYYNRFRILNDTINHTVSKNILERHIKIVDTLEEREIEKLRNLYHRPLYNSAENITKVVKKYPDYFDLSVYDAEEL